MKRLFWRLNIEHNKEIDRYIYTAEKRTWFIVIYLILTFPIFSTLYVFSYLYNLYLKPFNVYDKSITTSIELGNKSKRNILKQLINTNE